MILQDELDSIEFDEFPDAAVSDREVVEQL